MRTDPNLFFAPDLEAPADYRPIYRRDYDATYGSPREIGISGVQPGRPWGEDDDERRARADERARLERLEEETKVIDAVKLDELAAAETDEPSPPKD